MDLTDFWILLGFVDFVGFLSMKAKVFSCPLEFMGHPIYYVVLSFNDKRLHCEDPSVNALQGNDNSLFWQPYGTNTLGKVHNF
jgi:hypothetical protein